MQIESADQPSALRKSGMQAPLPNGICQSSALLPPHKRAERGSVPGQFTGNWMDVPVFLKDQLSRQQVLPREPEEPISSPFSSRKLTPIPESFPCGSSAPQEHTHRERTRAETVSSSPVYGDTKLMEMMVPISFGSRVSINIPTSEILRAMPRQTPSGVERYTGNALS